MSKKNKYDFPPEAGTEETPPEPTYEFVLIYHQAIVLENRVIYPGQSIDRGTYDKIPKFMRHVFWEIGKEVEPRLYNKLSKELQKHFKIKA